MQKWEEEWPIRTVGLVPEEMRGGVGVEGILSLIYIFGLTLLVDCLGEASKFIFIFPLWEREICVQCIVHGKREEKGIPSVNASVRAGSVGSQALHARKLAVCVFLHGPSCLCPCGCMCVFVRLPVHL